MRKLAKPRHSYLSAMGGVGYSKSNLYYIYVYRSNMPLYWALKGCISTPHSIRPKKGTLPLPMEKCKCLSMTKTKQIF